MEFDKVIRDRTAVRSFSDKKVEQEKIDQILEAGRLAPTAKDLQPIKIYVINNDEGLSKIDKASPCRYNAQACLIVCGNKDEAFSKGDYSTYEVDASIVATHMVLEATNVGVGSVWVAMFDEEILKSEFNIPENIKPVCLIPLGYKTDDYTEGSMHRQRKSIEEIVEYK